VKRKEELERLVAVDGFVAAIPEIVLLLSHKRSMGAKILSLFRYAHCGALATPVHIAHTTYAATANTKKNE